MIKPMIKPPLFGKTVAADNRRMNFDFANEQLLYMKKQVDILFIGDSITEFWDLNVYFNTNKLLLNRGIGGDVSEYLLKRFDADCIQLKPKICVLMIGTNDITSIDEDLWWRTPGENDEIVIAQFQNNIVQIAEKCKNSNVDLAICSIIPSNICKPFKNDERKNITVKLNEFLKNICEMYMFKYIDYHFNLCQKDGKTIRDDLTLDGIHLNPRGYEIISTVLKNSINI